MAYSCKPDISNQQSKYIYLIIKGAVKAEPCIQNKQLLVKLLVWFKWR